MTDHTDIVERLASTSVVIGNLPQLPGYNGSILTIDDEEAARCVADIDAGRAEITRLRAEAEALRQVRAVAASFLKDETGNAEKLRDLHPSLLVQHIVCALIESRAEAEALRKDSERRHQLLILQHAESVELWNALKDLSFECDGVTRTEAPSRDTYNKTFAVLQRKLHLSPEALRGYGESGQSQTLEATKGTT